MPNTLLKKSSPVKKNTAYQEELAYYDRSGHKRVPTIKQLQFAREYVRNKGNGLQAVKASYDIREGDDDTAKSIAVENFTKPYIRQEVMKLLEKNSVGIDDIVTIHKRNMIQKKNLPTSQKAVTDFYDILGMKGQDNDKKQQVNVALVINK